MNKDLIPNVKQDKLYPELKRIIDNDYKRFIELAQIVADRNNVLLVNVYHIVRRDLLNS